MATSPDRRPDEPDWEDRTLCSDGACIGVINDDGVCNVCGKAAPNWGDERRRGKRESAEIEAEVEAHVVATSTPAAPDDFDQRKLCPDGACIGVINDQGVCTVCGTPAE
jgi:hypothetical protein